MKPAASDHVADFEGDNEPSMPGSTCTSLFLLLQTDPNGPEASEDQAPEGPSKAEAGVRQLAGVVQQL